MKEKKITIKNAKYFLSSKDYKIFVAMSKLEQLTYLQGFINGRIYELKKRIAK